MVVLFVDMKAAFDSVDREVLLRAMRGKGVREQLVVRCEEILRETTCRVRVGDEERERFWTARGVKQGCPLSPSLFTLLIADMEEELKKEDGGSLHVGVCRRRTVGHLTTKAGQKSISKISHKS